MAKFVPFFHLSVLQLIGADLFAAINLYHLARGFTKFFRKGFPYIYTPASFYFLANCFLSPHFSG